MLVEPPVGSGFQRFPLMLEGHDLVVAVLPTVWQNALSLQDLLPP
jgi:hypothetical protein